MTGLSLDKLTELRLLLEVEGIGPGKLRNLLTCFRSTAKVLSAEFNSLTEVEGISLNLAKRIQRINSRYREFQDIVRSELENLHKMNASVVTIWDHDYPAGSKKNL